MKETTFTAGNAPWNGTYKVKSETDNCQWCGISRQTHNAGQLYHCGSSETWQSQYCEQAAEINRLKIALADAIRRPMGVVPSSAEEFFSERDLANAEELRKLTTHELRRWPTVEEVEGNALKDGFSYALLEGFGDDPPMIAKFEIVKEQVTVRINCDGRYWASGYQQQDGFQLTWLTTSK